MCTYKQIAFIMLLVGYFQARSNIASDLKTFLRQVDHIIQSSQKHVIYGKQKHLIYGKQKHLGV